PIVDAIQEPPETVIITLSDTADYDVGSPQSATVTISDSSGDCFGEGTPLVNGATHCGAISNAGEVDSWSFQATAGDRIAVHIGEIVDNNDFGPWLQLQAPNGAILRSVSGTEATAIEAVATLTGTYHVLVSSFDSGLNGTGTYRLTMARTPGPI